MKIIPKDTTERKFQYIPGDRVWLAKEPDRGIGTILYFASASKNFVRVQWDEDGLNEIVKVIELRNFV